MRKFLTVIALGSAVLFGGCATLNDPGGLDRIIAQVQSIARATCSFVPTAATVAEILAAGQLTVPFAVANAICAAVTAPVPRAAPGTRAARVVPRVSGVPVRGRFVAR